MAAKQAIFPTSPPRFGPNGLPSLGSVVDDFQKFQENGQQSFVSVDRTSYLGDGATVDEEPILAQPLESYKPVNLKELVRSTPAEHIHRTLADLDRIPKHEVNGRIIDPLPPEVQWIIRAELKTDILYTFIKDVVHRELERFAERIDEHYVLVPRR